MYKRILAWVGVLVLLAGGIIFAVPGSRHLAIGYARREPCINGLPVSYYVHALHSTHPEARSKAAFVLGQVGPEGEAAVPALAEALRDPDDLVRINAALALYKIGPGAQEAVPALTVALEDDVPLVRMDAALSLSRLGTGARQAVPALLAALGRTDNRPTIPAFGRSVRQQAATALGRIGPEAREAVPALTTALNDEEDVMRQIAAEALHRIESEAAQPAVPAGVDGR